MIDLDIAQEFISTLCGDLDDVVTLQTFSDVDEDDRSVVRTKHTKDIRKDKSSLEALSLRGAGIFIAVNSFGTSSRKVANVKKLRAFYADFDNGSVDLALIKKRCPIEPTMIVESSPGKFHLYWVLESPCGSDKKDVYKRIQDSIISHFIDLGADQIKDVSRVLRLPGSLHKKSKPFMTRIVENSGVLYQWSEVEGVFPPKEEPAIADRLYGVRKLDNDTYEKEVDGVDDFINNWINQEAKKLSQAPTGGRHTELKRVLTSVYHIDLPPGVLKGICQYLKKTWDKLHPGAEGEFYKLVDWCEGEVVADTVLKERFEPVVLAESPNLTLAVIPKEHPKAPFDLKPAGLIKEIAEFADKGNHRYQPLLSFAGALAFCGTLFSRRWVHWEMKTRTHLYVMCIAYSGAGKDATRQALANIANDENINLPNLAMKQNIASAPGLYEDMCLTPVQLLCIDEIHELFHKISNARASSWERAIKTDLMSNFSSAGGTIPPPKRKLGEMRKEDQMQLVNPALSVYGTTTPTVYKALKSGDVMDGFLNRFLVFESNVLPDTRRGERRDIPTLGLVKNVKRALQYGPSYYKTVAGATELPSGGTILNSQIRRPASSCGVVRETEEATELRWKYISEVDNMMRISKARDVWVRTSEYMTKLSMILCLSEMPVDSNGDPDPVIEVRHIEWAYTVAKYCAHYLETLASDNISENPYDERFKYLLNKIKKNKVIKGAEWKKPRHPSDDRVIKQMLEDGLVSEAVVERKGPGRKAKLYTYTGD